MENGGDIKGVFERFCKLSNAIKGAAEGAGKTLMEDPNLGFLGTCPSNLGTGLRASFMIVLPELNKDVHKLEEICASFDLQPRGSSGEHSAAVGGKWDISNKQRIGFTEVELVQKMIDGVTKLIALEEEMAAAAGGAPAAEAEAAPAAPAGDKDCGSFKLPEIEPAFDTWLNAQLMASPADDKDTDEFKYITFTEMPPFADAHKSLMRKTLTPELFASLKDVKSSKGYTLSNGMQAGVLRPHLGVGFTMGDEECFTLFKDLIYPIVEGWHKFDPASQVHKSDLNWESLVFSEEQAGKFATYVKSTRVRAARNISGLSLPAGSSVEDRLEVEKVMVEAFKSLPEELQGTYFPLGALTSAQEEELQAGGFMFQKPGPMQLLGAAGAGRSWPDGRGIFHNEAKTVLSWSALNSHTSTLKPET
jgi:creatine kinase